MAPRRRTRNPVVFRALPEDPDYSVPTAKVPPWEDARKMVCQEGGGRRRSSGTGLLQVGFA